MWLSDDTFRTVVASAPLVSIDLVVENTAGEILLGERLNRPAQGFWFVPGGRVQKNETLDDAFIRLTLTELGHTFERDHARFLGVFEHFYQDSVFGLPGVSNSAGGPDTHYAVLAYHLSLPAGQHLTPPNAQHGQFRWWARETTCPGAKVHPNTLAYLEPLATVKSRSV